MIEILLILTKQLGVAVGAGVVAATARYLEKKSIIRHYRRKINNLTKQ